MTFPSVPLSEVCGRISSGGTPSRKRPDYFAEIDGHPWVKSQELVDASIHATSEHISDLGLANSSAKYYPPDTILLAMYGANVGQLGLLRIRATVNQAICGLCIDPSAANSRYVFYSLLQERKRLVGQAAGAAQQNLNQDLIRNFRVPLPPLSLQHKIAAILSTYDDLIENNNRRIKILEELAQRIYREWFVDFRYPGHENGSLVDSELGLMPDGWKVLSFAELGEYVNGYAFKPGDWSREGLPIVKIRELKNGVSAETPLYFGDLGAKYAIRDGDLLFSWSAHLDAYLWTGGPAWLNQHLFRVDPSASVPTAFLFHALKERMGEFRSRSQGTTMRHIKRSALNQVTVVVPPDATRNAFAALVAPVDDMALALVRATRNLRDTRDLLLPRLVSGKVDVEGLDIAMPEAA